MNEAAQKAVRDSLEALVNHLCPTCHQPVEAEEQVGRCVYAQPCGHRMLEGKAKAKGAANA